MCDKTRQTYYEKLKLMGFPDLIAASISAQANNPKTHLERRTMESVIYSFCDWTKTKEGADFWILFKNSLP
jgi:hypothetical protein